MKIFSRNTNLGLRHLRAAVTVMDEGSFTRAADRLGVVPSALTETIRVLEQESGTLIFDRKTRPVRPTAAGYTYLRSARDILDRFESALIDLRQIGGVERGRVLIGASPSSVVDPLTDAILRFHSDHPDIGIVIHDDVAERLGTMVAEEKLDFALAGRGAPLADVEERKVFEDPFGLVCHRDHPLASLKRQIRLADIDPLDIISLEGETGIARMLAAEPSLPTHLREGRLRTFSTIAQLTLISRNAGIGLLPRRAAQVIQSKSLTFLTIEDLKLVRSLYIMTPARKTLSPAAERFISYL